MNIPHISSVHALHVPLLDLALARFQFCSHFAISILIPEAVSPFRFHFSKNNAFSVVYSSAQQSWSFPEFLSTESARKKSKNSEIFQRGVSETVTESPNFGNGRSTLQTLDGSFSAVSTNLIARVGSFESIFTLYQIDTLLHRAKLRFFKFLLILYKILRFFRFFLKTLLKLEQNRTFFAKICAEFCRNCGK